MISALLAAFIVCGDVRDIPDPTAPPCSLAKQDKLCGCGGTLIWDPNPADHFVIERSFLGVWVAVGTAPMGQYWWKFTEDRPLPFPGFLYVYRVWAVNAAGVRSLQPSNPVRYLGAPLTCVDPVTYRKVSCWPVSP